MLVLAGVGGASASAAGAPAAAVMVQAVTISMPTGDSISTPAAQTAGGDAGVSVSGWSSSADQPIAQIGQGSSLASLSPDPSGHVELTDLNLLGGELQLGSFTLTASQAAGSPAVDLSGQMALAGVPLALPAVAGSAVPLADWGQISAGVTIDDGSGTGSEVVGLRIEVLADHGGLPAGSEIRVGVVSFAAPAPSDGGVRIVTPPPLHPPSHRHHQRHHRHHGRRAHHHHSHRVDHPSHLPQLGNGVRARVVRAAAGQIGWPYVWGGESRSEGGFDCSGLVDYAYATAGRPLPGRPTAAALWRIGIPIDRNHLRPGDLAFLGAPSGDPYHVALYAGGGTVIVASGRGEPIAAIPLASVPWDGFARVWADGHGAAKARRAHSGRLPRSTRLDLAADRLAAMRAVVDETPAVGGHRDRLVRWHARTPQPPRPKPATPSAITVGDVRVRFAPGRAVGPLPTA
ncbi:MAG: peptidoglycan DL-endopeptidase CwlO [Gaiellales bacterium]|nr:peptidoglycan DL-endopeptidase CwlO [Gaiellales bacterium]